MFNQSKSENRKESFSSHATYVDPIKISQETIW